MEKIIHAIYIHKSYYVMDFYTEIPSIENTIHTLHIMSDFHSGYIHNFYHDKQ